MPQVVRKYLSRRNAGLLTQILHLSPDITSVKRFAAFGYKEYACCDSLFNRIPKQFLLQSLDNEHLSCLTLKGNYRLTSPDSLNRYKFQFTDTNARSADGLYRKG